MQFLSVLLIEIICNFRKLCFIWLIHSPQQSYAIDQSKSICKMALFPSRSSVYEVVSCKASVWKTNVTTILMKKEDRLIFWQ